MTVVAEPILSPQPRVDEGASSPASSPRRRFSPWWTILLLTILAGVLRFSFIDKPPLWGDDAATWSRICGSYSQMLGSLEDAGFGPLHYEMYWWIKSGLPVWFKTEIVNSDPNAGGVRRRNPFQRSLPQKTELTPVVRLILGGVTMTPFVMRLVPAMAGTLMVPAMYWLASQLVNRRAALIAATFVAFSAYMLNYSRDAKMYMHLWLLCTVHVACLLWWLRVRSRHAWYCWVASGIAMVGLQTVSYFILGIEVLIVLTARRSHLASLGKLLMLLPWIPMVLISPLLSLMKADAFGDRGPVGRFFQRRFERFGWPPIVFFLAGALIIGSGSYIYYNYFCVFFDEVLPESAESPDIREMGISWVQAYNVGRDGLDLVKFTASSFFYNWEWPRYAPRIGIDDSKQIDLRTYRLLYAAGITLSGLLLLGALPWPRRWIGTSGIRFSDRSWWRPTLLLGVWLVVPFYVFYCMSIQGFLSPLGVLAQAFLKTPPRVDLPHAMPWVDFATFSAAFKKAFVEFSAAFTFANIRWWLVGMIILFAAVGTYFSSTVWSVRMRRLLAGGSIILSILVICEAVHLLFNRPFEGSVWMPRYLGFTFPAFAMLLAVLLSRLPTRWLRWPAVGLVIAVNLAVISARVFAGTEPPIDQIAKDMLLDRDNDTVATYYVSPSQFGTSPGMRGLNGPGNDTTTIARYYLAVLSNRPTTPAEARGGRRGVFIDEFKLRRFNPFGAAVRIINDVKADPKLQHLIVWERLNTGEVDLTDRIADTLGPDWKRVSEVAHQARDHWTWREHGNEFCQYRRREYVRIIG